jgi:hypothetical protein
MSYIFPAVTLALMVTGFVIQKRNRSPYTGRPMDAESITNYRRGEAIFLLGSVCYLIDLLLVRR